MNKKKTLDKKDIISLIFNIILIILGFTGVITTYKNLGNFALEYYTQLSNYFALGVAIIYTLCLVVKKEIPKLVSVLKYSATLSLMVTFLVVAFILTPMYGFKNIFVWIFFKKSNLYFHTLCPIITFVSFIFFEKHNIKGLKDNIRAVYFTIAYAAVTIVLNILKKLDGPYPFLQVYNQPIIMSVIWFLVIIGGAFGFARFIMWIKNKQEKEY